MNPFPDITLYGAYASRSFTARWMLAELDLPYQFHRLDLRKDEHKAAAYRAINPMGKVPAIKDGGTIVTETSAICLYLADRYGYGRLCPVLDDPRRGAYFRWAVFATAVAEPGIYIRDDDLEAARGRGWGLFGDVLAALDVALTPGPWLLGELFTAADVTLGAVLSVALFNKRFEPTAAIAAYNERLSARAAYKRAAEETWPPHLFPV
ncbi:MAG TPA: glutathione S-transferase family protein [Caulobacteraceae bacterium]|nr:glutathione S-transferase family protein [Caulobacteraceae bacterium]